MRSAVRADKVRLRKSALAPATVSALASVVEMLPSAALVLDPRGVIRCANAGFSKLSGLALDDVLGQLPADVLPAGLAQSLATDRLHRAAPSDTAAPDQVAWPAAAGRLQWVTVQITAARRPDGVLSHFIVVLADVTGRQADEDARAAAARDHREIVRLSLVARHIPHSVVIADPEGRAIWANETWTQLTGFRLEEIVGRRPHDLLAGPDTDLEAQRQIAAAIAEQRAVQLEMLGYRRDGSAMWANVSYTPVMDDAGVVTQFISVISDITSRKRVEFEIAEQRLFLQRVIDAAPSLIFVKDATGRYILANAAAIAAFGHSAETLRTLTDFDFVTEPGLAEQFRQHDLKVLETLADHVMPEGSYRQADGSTRWTQTIKRAIYAPGSTQPHVLGVVTDITAWKAAQVALNTSEERLRLALAAAQGGIWDLDATTGAMWFSDTMRSLLGPMAEMGTTTFRFWLEQVHPDDLPGVRAGVAAHLKGLTDDFTLDYRLAQAGMPYRWVRARGQVIQRDATGRALRAVGTLLDIEEQKRTEAVLRAAKEAAEEANRTKSEFLARMSHELRTPLNSIIGFTSVLLDSSRGLAPEKAQLYLSRVQQSGTHLLGLINDILDLAKVESGKVEVELSPIDVAALLHEVAQSCEAQGRLKGIEIEVDDGSPHVAGPLMTDARLLKQVVLNLIANAMKFTDAGVVQLALEIDPLRRVPLGIRVSDSGIGIPEDRLEAIFDPFEQAEGSATTRRFGGTGLGLAISRELCTLLGATLAVTSEVGLGSTFTISF